MGAMTERFEMRFDPGTLAQIDEWRAQQPDIPSRAEAIRRLIKTGLTLNQNTQIAFSDGERLIVHLLCELLNNQSTERDTDLNLVQEALYGGHLWALERRFPGIFHRSEDSHENVHETTVILNMWRVIEFSYKELTLEERKRIEKEADPFGKDVRFKGFSGNDECEHLGIADFLIDKLDLFREFKGRDLNAHMPFLPNYRHMLHVFEPMQKNLLGGYLSADQLITLLNAMRYDAD